MTDTTSLGLCCGSLVQADFRALAEAASGAAQRLAESMKAVVRKAGEAI